MKTIFQILSVIFALVMLSACSKENEISTHSNSTGGEGKVLFDLDAEVIEGSSSRGFDIEAQADRARPQITASVGELIDTYLFFAYADKSSDGTPINIQITSPIATQLRVTEVKGEGNSRQIILQIREKDIDIPQYPANKDKMWFVCGVIGGKVENGTLQFDPNPNLILGDTLSIGTKKKLQIPYTFGWQAIKFAERTLSNGSKTDAFYIKDAKFYPRGLFLRIAIKNNGINPEGRPWGSYVLEKLRVKNNSDYTPKATFSPQATATSLMSNGLSGFEATVIEDQEFEFKHSIKRGHLGKDDNGRDLGYADVKAYEHVVGKDRFSSNPELERKRREKTGYFWLWLADLKPNAQEVHIDIIGDPLGLLRPKQSFILKNLKFETGKTNTTLARDLTLTRAQLSYMPLEFVSRGNVVRDYSTGSLKVGEVDQKWTYPGASSIGLWLGGASFGADELFTYTTQGRLAIDLDIKEKNWLSDNRYIPTVDDWRTVIPHFREDTWQDEIKPYKEERTRYYEYMDKDGYLQINKIFGHATLPTFGTGRKLINGVRKEYTVFRDPEGGESIKEMTQARYKPSATNNNVYYGVRHLREMESNFYQRRRYFSAYRVESTVKGLMIQAYYIGTDGSKEGDGMASWSAVEAQWLEKIANEDFWKQKMADGEVIERKFPIGGKYQSGSTVGEWSRYHVQNLRIVQDEHLFWVPDSDYSTFQFKPNFGTAFAGIDSNPGGDAVNCLLRYFVVDPQEAYYQWGSKN